MFGIKLRKPTVNQIHYHGFSALVAILVFMVFAADGHMPKEEVLPLIAGVFTYAFAQMFGIGSGRGIFSWVMGCFIIVGTAIITHWLLF